MKKLIIRSSLLVVGLSFLTLSLNSFNKVDSAKAEVVVSDNDTVRLAVTSFGKDASSTMTFTWNTTNYTNTVVELVEGDLEFSEANIVRVNGTIEKSKASSEDGYIHRVITSNLKANTVYKYRVGDPSLHMSEIGTFKTGSDSFSPVSFMHISDPQGISEGDYLSYGKLLETSTSAFDFDFIALTGDIVNNSWKGYNPTLSQWERAITDQHHILKDYPLMTVSGNHEAANYDFSSRFTYETSDNVKQSGVYYSYVYNGVYFLALNTNEGYDEDPGSSLSEEQLNFIRTDLEAHKDYKWKIVLMHKGLFDAGAHASNIAEGKDYDIEHYRKDLAPLFSEYNVDLVLQGHDHLYSKSYPIESSVGDNGVTHRAKKDVINEVKDGVSYAYKPAAPIYFNTGSASGSKYYAVNMDENMSEMIDFAYNPMAKLFTHIEINEDLLTFKTYTQSNDTYQLYKAYGINKGELLNPDSNSSSSENDNLDNDNPTTEINLPLIITLSVVGGVILIGGIILVTVLFSKRRKK